MAESRNLVYYVGIETGAAKSTIESLKKEFNDLRNAVALLKNERLNIDSSKLEASVTDIRKQIDELRKSIGAANAQKITIDDSAFKASIGEIRKELEGLKGSINEISKGRLTVSDGNIQKAAENGAKGIEGLQVATKKATTALQTYQQKLTVVRNAIDNLTQMTRNGIATKIDINGISYSMAQLRAFEEEYKQAVRAIKAGSLESQEKTLAHAEAVAAKKELEEAKASIQKFREEFQKSMDDGIVHISERTYRRHKAAWDDANEILKKNGQKPTKNLYDFGENKGFQEFERRVTGYYDRLAAAQKSYDSIVESSNRQRERGVKLTQTQWEDTRAAIAKARQELESFGKLADLSKTSRLTENNWTDYLKGIDGDSAQSKYVRQNIDETQSAINARKTAAIEAEKALQKAEEERAKAEKKAEEEREKAARKREQDIERYKARLDELNHTLEFKNKTGNPLGADRYYRNYNEAKALEKRLNDLGVPAESKYKENPESYAKSLAQQKEAIRLQRELNAEVERYAKLVNSTRSSIAKGTLWNSEDYAQRLKRFAESMDKILTLYRKGAELSKPLPSNPLEDPKYNTYDNYSRSIKDANAVANADKIKAVSSYSAEVSRLQKSCESLYMTYQKDPTSQNLANFAATRNALVATQREYANFQRRVESAGHTVGSFFTRLKSHASWIVSGILVGGGVAGIADVFSQMTELDQQMASIRQVIPQIEANPNEAGTEKFANEQKMMNQAMTDFIGIAGQYGVATGEVMEAARSIGRMYGQGDNGLKNTEIFTAQAAKMSVADAFPMLDAVKGLEAAMSQWNLQTDDSTKLMRNSQYILDIWTRTAHSGAASAQDIGQAIENAGTAAAQAGVSFDFFNSLVEAGVRATSRSGNEIGQSIKSMMVSMQSDKSARALKQWGIELTEVGEDGKKHMRSMEDVIMDVSMLVSTTTKDTQKLISVLAGGRYQYSKVSAILKSYKEILRMQGILNDGNTKGFTDSQIQVQLDTIQRKFQQIKADLTQTVAQIGQGGGVNEIKYVLTTIDNVIVGINKFNESMADGENHIRGYIRVIAGLGAAYLALRKGVGAYERAVGAYQASETAQKSGGSGITVWDNYRKSQRAKGAMYGAGKAATDQAIIDATNGETAAKSAETAAENANSAATANNSNQKRVSAAATSTSAGAATREASAKASEAAAETADAAATAGNTAKKTAATAATMREATAARSAAGANAANAVSERAAGVAAGVLGTGSRVAAAGMATLSTATRIANVALAAFGGPVGLAITALSIIVPFLISDAEAAGEAANAEQNLKNAMEERIASAEEEVSLAERQGQAAEKLAKNYNTLEDKIKSGTLTTEEATKAKQHQGEIEETVRQILGASAVQFDEDGKMNLETIRKLAAANKGKSAAQLKQDAAEMRSKARQIRMDISGTKTAVENARTRIDNMKKEAASCGQLATAYGAVYSFIAGLKAAIGNFKIKEAADLEDLANSYGDKAGDKSFLGWYGFARDSRIDGIGGPEAARAEAARLREEGLQANEEAVRELKEAGGSQHDAEAIVNNCVDAIGNYTETLENVNADREGEAEHYEKMAAESYTAAEEIENNNSDDIGTSHNNGNEDINDYSKPKQNKGSHSVPKDNKEVYEYDTETARAAFNLGHYLSEEGLDAETMLALVKIANGLNGIKKEDLEGLTDPFQTGGENPMRSAWLLGQKYYERKQPGMAPIDVLAALYPNADIRGQLEPYFVNITKGEKKTPFAGYDFSSRAPKNGEDFEDENNKKVSSGYVANNRDYENGGYTSPELRKIADETAEIIRQNRPGAQVNSDFLYGQMMAEGGYGANQQEYHNYAGIGPWHRYASDEEFEKDYAHEYYIDDNRMNALAQPTASGFVRILDNVDENWHPGNGAWNADDNQYIYTQNIDKYANEGKQTSAPVNTSGDIDATPTGILGANYDIKWDDSDELNEEFKTKLAMFHEHFLRAAQIAAGSANDFEVTSTTGGSHDDPNHAAGKAADLVSNLFYDADFRSKMTAWAEAHGLRVYDEYDRANWTGKTTGDNYHVSDAGGAAADFSQTAKAASADFSAAGISVKGAGVQIVDAWKGTQKGLYSWNQSGIEMKRSLDQFAKSLHDTTQAVIEFGQKINGNLDPQQHEAAFYDARVQVAQTTQNVDFWRAAKEKTNNALWATLHDGKHNDVLAAIGDTDFGKLSDASQNELASKAKNSKDLQQAVKNNQMAKAGYNEAFGASLKARGNYADVVGHMTQDNYVKTQMSEVDNYYSEQEMSHRMPKYKADEQAAKAKLEILNDYKKKLNENLVASMKQTDEDLLRMGNDRVTAKDRVDDAQVRFDKQDAAVKALQAKGNPADAEALDAAIRKREEINNELESEKTHLKDIDESIEQTKKLGNTTMRNTISELHNVATETKKCNDIINESSIQLQNTITSGFHTMFSDVLLEGKSFADSFKNLWKSIGQLALNILMNRFLDPWIGGLFGHAGGGSIDKKATGGILGYAGGGQAGGAIHGAGDGTSDSILAYLANKDQFVYLSNGEYVMTAEATQRIGKDNLDRMNYNKYAMGGAISPTPYVPNLSPVATKKVQNLSHENSNKRLEELMMDQTNTIRQMGSNGGNGGGVVVLNTHASSDDVMKALSENPRAVQAILGRQQHFGFR